MIVNVTELDTARLEQLRTILYSFNDSREYSSYQLMHINSALQGMLQSANTLQLAASS